jgi:dipeptidyl aminopeptidase
MTSPTPYHDNDLEASFSPPSERGRDNFPGRSSLDSVSTTSLVLERIHPSGRDNILYDDPEAAVADKENLLSDDEDDYSPDIERGRDALLKPMEKKMRRAVYIVAGVLIGGWVLALIVYLSKESIRLRDAPHEAGAAKPGMATEPLTMDQVHGGTWLASKRGIQWISDGQKDGLMLVPGAGTPDQGYLEIHDVRNDSDRHVLMRKKTIKYDRKTIRVSKYWPSPDLKHVLLASSVKSVCVPVALSWSLWLTGFSAMAILVFCEILAAQR